MQEEERTQEFYARWNLRTDDPMEHRRIKNRMANLVELYLGEDERTLAKVADVFCFEAGLEKPVVSSWTNPPFALGWMMGAFKNIRTYPELYVRTHHLLSVLAGVGFSRITDFAQDVQKAFNLSPQDHIRVVFRGSVPDIYPKGDPFLDEALVDDNLRSLGKHKKSREEFHKALTMFQRGNPSEVRNVPDNLRFSLESLLRQILKNRNTLEKQKEALGRWLKEKGLHQELVNMAASTVKRLALYNNDWAKHHGSDHVPGTAELEFVIYETGVLMRLLIELDKGCQDASPHEQGTAEA